MARCPSFELTTDSNTELSELNAAPTDEELTDQLAALEKEVGYFANRFNKDCH